MREYIDFYTRWPYKPSRKNTSVQTRRQVILHANDTAQVDVVIGMTMREQGAGGWVQGTQGREANQRRVKLKC